MQTAGIDRFVGNSDVRISGFALITFLVRDQIDATSVIFGLPA